jgi:hypothetical protein
MTSATAMGTMAMAVVEDGVGGSESDSDSDGDGGGGDGDGDSDGRGSGARETAVEGAAGRGQQSGDSDGQLSTGDSILRGTALDGRRQSSGGRGGPLLWLGRRGARKGGWWG